jgi:hypothetical protein
MSSAVAGKALGTEEDDDILPLLVTVVVSLKP